MGSTPMPNQRYAYRRGAPLRPKGMSQFESDADKARFAQAFADRFFFRKKAAPSAVHLFIEEAQEFVPQAEDPRALRAEIARLKGELAKKSPAVPKDVTRREVEVVKPATVKAVERAIDRCDAAIARVNGLVVNLRGHVEAAEARGAELATVRDALVGELRALRVGQAQSTTAVAVLGGPRPESFVVRTTPPPPARSPAQPPAEGLTGPRQAILDTVAMLGVCGIRPERDTVARWLGIHPRGGSLCREPGAPAR